MGEEFIRMTGVKNIIFDLGGVLIRWDPRNLYSKIFQTEAEVDYFLETICTKTWNEEQDAGRSVKKATETLVQQYPFYQQQIEAFYGRWPEMLDGIFEGTSAIFQTIKAGGRYRLFALSNWSVETFPIAKARYKILNEFEGIVLSGEEKIIKPDPKIYEILLQRYKLSPEECLFIDDSQKNTITAKHLGFNVHHFTTEENLFGFMVKNKII